MEKCAAPGWTDEPIDFNYKELSSSSVDWPMAIQQQNGSMMKISSGFKSGSSFWDAEFQNDDHGRWQASSTWSTCLKTNGRFFYIQVSSSRTAIHANEKWRLAKGAEFFSQSDRDVLSWFWNSPPSWNMGLFPHHLLWKCNFASADAGSAMLPHQQRKSILARFLKYRSVAMHVRMSDDTWTKRE